MVMIQLDIRNCESEKLDVVIDVSRKTQFLSYPCQENGRFPQKR